MIGIVVPLVLGSISVIQAGLNRQIAFRWGLGGAVAVNAAVLVSCVAIYLVVGASQREASILARPLAWSAINWWWVLPGLFGFAIVTGLPFVLARAGALAVFVGVVAGQMAASLAWDAWVEGIVPSVPRALGALLTIGGVVLVSWK